MNEITRHRLVVITPVYEDLEASSRLFRELVATLGHDIFVVVIDDGSVRHPLDENVLKQTGGAGVILKLRRNVGHQRAISIGLGFAAEQMINDTTFVIMDSDGEDLPSSILPLLERLSNDNVDVVVASRKKRIETLHFKAFYAAYKRFFQIMTGRTICFGNFMALKRPAIERLVSMQELSIHVAGAVLASRLRTVYYPLDRGPRYAGKSKMNFVGLALHGFKGLMVFAEDVLVRVGIACALIASLSIVGFVAAIILKLLGVSTPGWFSVALGILVLMLLQTGALALMSLMLTGVVRGGGIIPTGSYRSYIRDTIKVGS